MRIEDCYKKRLLRVDKPDKLKTKKALEMATLKIQRAAELLDSGFHEEAIVTSYTSMFHAARALLFKDGVIERSHACAIAYLSKEYNQSLGHNHISWIDTYRLERHESFYGLESFGIDKSESEDALNKSKKFLESIKKIINDS